MNPERVHLPETVNNNVIVVVTGLALGEETKGATVQWITKELGAHTVIRSGGCQAGHHLVFADGTDQMLSHFGCGVFEGANTHLKHMAIFPTYLYEEALELEEKGIADPLKKITIDEDCVVVTPFHGAYSRLKERSRGEHKRGTVGMGVSEAVEESRTRSELSIKAGEFLGNTEELFRKVDTIRQNKLAQARELLGTYEALLTLEEAQKDFALLTDEAFSRTVTQSFLYLADLVRIVDDEYLDEILAEEGAVVCEPDHGALHHPRYGFVPHITQVDPTAQDVLETLSKHEHSRRIIRLGVSRCYMTRHGAGPLVSFSREMSDKIQETHNITGSEWLGEFRNGYYDVIAIRYSLQISGGRERFDGLAISYLDVLDKFNEWQVVEAYAYEGEPDDDLNQYFELIDGKITGIKVHPDDGSPDHLNHQMRLTEHLKHCTPILTTLNPTGDTSLEQVFLDYVEEKLGLPVIAVARGPRADDREKRKGWEKLFDFHSTSLTSVDPESVLPAPDMPICYA